MIQRIKDNPHMPRPELEYEEVETYCEDWMTTTEELGDQTRYHPLCPNDIASRRASNHRTVLVVLLRRIRGAGHCAAGVSKEPTNEKRKKSKKLRLAGLNLRSGGPSENPKRRVWVLFRR